MWRASLTLLISAASSSSLVSPCPRLPCNGVPATVDRLVPGVGSIADEPGVALSTLSCLVCLLACPSGDPVASCIDSIDSSRVVSSSSGMVTLGSSGGVCLACLSGELVWSPLSELACLPISLGSESELESESDELEEEAEEEDEEAEVESEVDLRRVCPVIAGPTADDRRSYSSRKRCRSSSESVRESKRNIRKYICMM